MHLHSRTLQIWYNFTLTKNLQKLILKTKVEWKIGVFSSLFGASGKLKDPSSVTQGSTWEVTEF